MEHFESQAVVRTFHLSPSIGPESLIPDAAGAGVGAAVVATGGTSMIFAPASDGTSTAAGTTTSESAPQHRAKHASHLLFHSTNKRPQCGIRLTVQQRMGAVTSKFKQNTAHARMNLELQLQAILY
eukprot:666813-Amphidinium_carterae.1